MIHHDILMYKIQKHLPNERMLYKTNKTTGNLEILFVNKKISITIFENYTWVETIRNIDLKINNERNNECSICYESEKDKRKIVCSKCVCVLCVDCYVNMFRVNKGIIKCPCCRFTYGKVFPDSMIEKGVQKILNFKL